MSIKRGEENVERYLIKFVICIPGGGTTRGLYTVYIVPAHTYGKPGNPVSTRVCGDHTLYTTALSCIHARLDSARGAGVS